MPPLSRFPAASATSSNGRSTPPHLDGEILGHRDGRKIVDRRLQLFGGYGYMDEYSISRL
jgi:hypothetical protein